MNSVLYSFNYYKFNTINNNKNDVKINYKIIECILKKI